MKIKQRNDPRYILSNCSFFKAPLLQLHMMTTFLNLIS